MRSVHYDNIKLSKTVVLSHLHIFKELVLYIYKTCIGLQIFLDNVSKLMTSSISLYSSLEFYIYSILAYSKRISLISDLFMTAVLIDILKEPMKFEVLFI